MKRRFEKIFSKGQCLAQTQGFCLQSSCLEHFLKIIISFSLCPSAKAQHLVITTQLLNSFVCVCVHVFLVFLFFFGKSTVPGWSFAILRMLQYWWLVCVPSNIFVCLFFPQQIYDLVLWNLAYKCDGLPWKSWATYIFILFFFKLIVDRQANWFVKADSLPLQSACISLG